MPDLQFKIESSEAVMYSATPLLALKLKISNQPAEQKIHSLSLRCQVQIEPGRRRYESEEKEDLKDLFGEPERWGRTVRPFLWMNTGFSVPGFSGSTLIDLQLPCTFDFNVAATKYFHALEAGEVPLCLMFSGTVFYSDSDGALQATQIPWDREANYRLPVATWRKMMDMHYPNSAWLCLQREAFERLYRYKVQHGLPTWEEAIERLIAAEEEVKV
ncbi:MAG: DUF6084 family protein [Terriglobales bacterium]